jgi:hypothetical protein
MAGHKKQVKPCQANRISETNFVPAIRQHTSTVNRTDTIFAKMNPENLYPYVLYHYYEARKGPFLNLSDLPLDVAEQTQAQLRQDPRLFASQRAEDYLKVRWALEEKVRRLFIQKGGKPQRMRPHYMIVGACPWVKQWYLEGAEVQIPLNKFRAENISFTYGDLFPAMRYPDGKPYRGRVYTLGELPALIGEYGLPQQWNAEGHHGPDRYIEAQIWDDEPFKEYLEMS